MADAELLSLAALAGRTLVAAAVTDAWEAVRQKFARLLSLGDADKIALAERRLDETREQLTAAPGQNLDAVTAELTQTWKIRVADLLEEIPSLEADLRSLIEEVQAGNPDGSMAISGHGTVAGRDVSITSSEGSVAAGTLYGGVSLGNPTQPGLAK